jgi:hypothetical protein
MAVINFVIGGLKLLALLCGGVGLLVIFSLLKNAPAQPGGPDVGKEITDLFESIPGYVPYLIGSLVLSVIMTILLLVSGFGLLNLRNWARMLCFVYAAYVILYTVGSLAYEITVVQPATEKWAAQFQKKVQAQQAKARPGQPPPPAPPAPGGNVGGQMGGLTVGLFQVAHAVALLVVLNLGDVRRAFAGLPPAGDERGYDRDDGWPRDRSGPRDPDAFEGEDRGWRRPAGDDRIEPGDR